MTWQLTTKTNRGRWFANETKCYGVKSNHPQTLGVYFAIYSLKKKMLRSKTILEYFYKNVNVASFLLVFI